MATDSHDSRRAEHVAIIMDGNGRWATRRGLPRLAGHKAGAERVREIVETCPDLGIRVLTLFAFSTENWKRSDTEVNGLMRLFRMYIRKESARLIEEGVCVRFIGSRERLAADLVEQMVGLEARTAANDKLLLNVAINYGGRDELARATAKIAEKVASGDIAPHEVTEATIADHLDTAGLPDPDLLIRTSGESRISNFLLWQAAYAEYDFTDTLWPDFTAQHLADCISRFSERERRFGAVAG
jgi:undecaprenyl diphosphate synthase